MGLSTKPGDDFGPPPIPVKIDFASRRAKLTLSLSGLNRVEIIAIIEIMEPVIT